MEIDIVTFWVVITRYSFLVCRECYAGTHTSTFSWNLHKRM